MLYTPFSKKIKVLALSVAMFAVFAMAGEGNINYYGQLGVHKTQSAQTLGHGRLGLGTFFEIATGLNTIIKDENFYLDNDPDLPYGIASYTGLNVFPFLSLGLSEYFDISIGFPLYGDYLRVGKDGDLSLSASGQGDLFVSIKLRAPFDDSFPIDFAIIPGLGSSTGKPNSDNMNDYGPWIRDPMFLNIKEVNPIGLPGYTQSSYTSTNSFFKFGVAGTLDFNRMKVKIPLLLHLNYAYRTPLGAEGANYPKVQSFATALEWTPVQFASFFGEYYNDMPTKWPENGSETDLSTISLGTSFHLSKNIDLQLGAQIFMGDEKKYIDSLAINWSNGNDGNKRKAHYSARLIPDYIAFAGFTVKLFTVEPEVEEEEEEYRNPDTDEDGVCDPWVSETGRQREFKGTCSGIDLCPYEAGPSENKGCPEKKVESAAPTIWFSASPDAIQKGQSVTLTWQVTNASLIEIEGIGMVEASGSKKVKPTESTTYTLTAIGDGGTRVSSVDIELSSGPVPVILFNTSSEVAQKGQSITLTWQVTNAKEVNIEGIGKVQASGSRKVKVTESTVYTLTAVGEGGEQTATVEIEVAAGPVPFILFSVNPESMQSGQSATLKWEVTNATEVNIDGGIGKVQVKGSKQVKPTSSTAYTLTAIGEGGIKTETVELEIAEPPPIEARVNLQGVTFGSGNATLTPNAKKVLDGVAEQLLANPKVKIEIQGHTDNQGKPTVNQELSERRAKSVVGYLATKGVKMSRMTAVGYGQDVPIADNRTADGRELNRRIEMIRVDD
jgi:outer membrane protein OmpA-like peptidoglycan-associated protein